MVIATDAFPKSISAPVRELITEYIQLSNAKSTHNNHDSNEDKFADLFTSDGIYEFAGKENTGHTEISDFREFLFNNIPHRDHPIEKVFPFGDNDKEVMVLGSVDYKFEDGKKHSTAWAARYSMVEEAGKLKFKKVQIILNPAHENEK